MTQATPVIGILILNRNGRDWLGPLYESIAANGYDRVVTYLVDNASDDGSVEMTHDAYPHVRVIRFSENLGYCMAYNRAMPVAFEEGCDSVVWANNDVLLVHGALSAMAEVMTSDPRIGICGPAFLAWDKDEPNYYMAGNHRDLIPDMLAGSRPSADVAWVEGSFLMVSRACVDDVGPLDPFLFFYWEETDYCRRARYRGWRVVIALRSLARHFAGGWSAASQVNRSAANFLKSRNLYIYYFADPNHGFLRNCLKVLHVFAVRIRAAAKLSKADMALESRSFLRVLRESRVVFRKWRRDRRGDRPEPMTASCAHVGMWRDATRVVDPEVSSDKVAVRTGEAG